MDTDERIREYRIQEDRYPTFSRFYPQYREIDKWTSTVKQDWTFFEWADFPLQSYRGYMNYNRMLDAQTAIDNDRLHRGTKEVIIHEYPEKQQKLEFVLDNEIHPDTYDKPFFVIVPTEVPENELMEQLYTENGEKYQIEGEDVRLAIRTEEAIPFGCLITPIPIMNFMRGKWAYDSISFKDATDERIKELLSMCKSYKIAEAKKEKIRERIKDNDLEFD